MQTHIPETMSASFGPTVWIFPIVIPIPFRLWNSNAIRNWLDCPFFLPYKMHTREKSRCLLIRWIERYDVFTFCFVSFWWIQFDFDVDGTEIKATLVNLQILAKRFSLTKVWREKEHKTRKNSSIFIWMLSLSHSNLDLSHSDGETWLIYTR